MVEVSKQDVAINVVKDDLDKESKVVEDNVALQETVVEVEVRSVTSGVPVEEIMPQKHLLPEVCRIIEETIKPEGTAAEVSIVQETVADKPKFMLRKKVVTEDTVVVKDTSLLADESSVIDTGVTEQSVAPPMIEQSVVAPPMNEQSVAAPPITLHHSAPQHLQFHSHTNSMQAALSFLSPPSELHKFFLLVHTYYSGL